MKLFSIDGEIERMWNGEKDYKEFPTIRLLCYNLTNNCTNYEYIKDKIVSVRLDTFLMLNEFEHIVYLMWETVTDEIY